ncbi:hypothetical protein EDM68_03330 [Candidatus Uhrbacteria bacterium]|nr:MAG: hypothetical protein EDM68_03330 [Candidatus Uhrbacteria bacterium]
MIVRRGRKWVVVSEKTGRSFGSYDTKKEAEHRLKQVEFFKHLKSIPKSNIRKAGLRKRSS